MALYSKHQERNGNWSVIRNADNVTLGTYPNEYKADRRLYSLRSAQRYLTKRANEKTERDRRIADHIDGYDRDDLGESPDY